MKLASRKERNIVSFMLLYPAYPQQLRPGRPTLTPEGSQPVTHEFYPGIYPSWREARLC